MSIKKDRLSISEENKVCIECFEEKSYSHFFPDFISEGIAYPIRVCRKCYEETHIRYAKKYEKKLEKSVDK